MERVPINPPLPPGATPAEDSATEPTIQVAGGPAIPQTRSRGQRSVRGTPGRGASGPETHEWQYTTGAAKRWAEDLNLYKILSNNFNQQLVHRTSLTKYVNETVSDTLRNNHCDPSDTVTIWYTNLKRVGEAEEGTMKQKARQQYHNAVHQLKKMPKDMDKWILQWETAMATAQRHKV